MAHLATARRRSSRHVVDPALTPALARAALQTGERRISIAIGAAALVLWELLARAGIINTLFFPAPTAIAAELIRTLANGVMIEHLSATLLRVFPGLLLGGTAGLVAGLAMGMSKRLRLVMDPFVAGLHPIPKLALLPLFMIMFGIGEWSRIVAIAVATFFPMLINAMAGVRQISPVHFEVARNYGADRWQILRRVVLPGSLPLVLAGTRLAANIALLITIAVEITASDTGLGALVWLSWQVLRVEQLYATLVVIAVLGVALTAGLQWIARRFVPWMPEPDRVT